MTFAGFPFRSGRNSENKNLHPQIWRRLQAAAARPSASPAEVLLFGPMGIGKSVLMRRLYWEAFTGQDTEVPLIVAVNPPPFRPRLWARRFLMEVCQQWVAFERRDEELAQANLLPVSDLIDLCNHIRLYPLVHALEGIRKIEESADSAAFVIEWALESVRQAAVKLQRPALLMIDSPENASWLEDGEAFHLTRLAQPLASPSPLRRLWGMRRSSSDSHPLLAPVPAGAEPWGLEPLNREASAEFFATLASNINLDYDDRLMNELLPLWGGIPRWIENFVRKCADSLLPFTTAEQIVQTYVDDLSDGLTARDLQAALNPPTGGVIDPADLARIIDAHLLSEEVRHGRVTNDEREETALRRLAQAGLAVYRQGKWRAPSVPLLSDFLRLYVARNLDGQDAAGSLVAVKRQRLIETPLAAGKSEAEARVQHLLMLLHTFRGQSVPAELFQSHRHQADEAPVAESGDLRRLPWCIGAFRRIDPSQTPRNLPRPIPAVVGWCFEEPTHFRSDEMLWVAYACDNPKITTEEIEQIERSNRMIGRELGVGRIVTWIVTDSRFSPEAIEGLSALGFLTSSWAEFERIGETMSESPKPRAAAPKPQPEIAKPVRALAEPEPIPPAVPEPTPEPEEALAQPDVRIVEARPSSAMEQVVELRLPPRADMELVAAGTIEQLGTSCGFSDKAIGQMKMATLEACLNAIERSRNKEKEVRVRLEANTEKFTILIENEGETFDPLAVEDPRIEDKLTQSYKRGWGLKLIRKFMDRVVFEPYDRGTRLRMEKLNVPPDPPHEIKGHSEA